VGIHGEILLNLDFGIHNERQNCKIGTRGGGTGVKGKVSRRYEDEWIWLMGFIYMYELE
jgi:hypothetical protein